MPPATSIRDVHASAKRGTPRTIAVACPHDDDVLLSLDRASAAGLVRPLLVGRRATMCRCPHLEVEVRLRQPQVAEECVGHVRVVVLARVHDLGRHQGSRASAWYSGAIFMKFGRAAAMRWMVMGVEVKRGLRA